MKTHLGVPHDAVWHPTIQKASDELCQEFFDLDVPVPAPDKASQALRTKREKRAAAVEQRDRLLAEGQKEEAAKVDVPYIWQDDLRARVLEAAAASKDEEDFFRQLTLRGVEGTRRKATRKQPEYYLYELVDTSGFSLLDSIPANLRSKSFKMGADYQPEGVAAMFRKEKTGVKDYAPKNDLVESPVRDETASGNTNRPPEKKTREIASETPQTAISPERANRDPYAMLNTGQKGHRDGGKTSGKHPKPVSEKPELDPAEEARRAAAEKRKADIERAQQKRREQLEVEFGDLANIEVEIDDPRKLGS